VQKSKWKGHGKALKGNLLALVQDKQLALDKLGLDGIIHQLPWSSCHESHQLFFVDLDYKDLHSLIFNDVGWSTYLMAGPGNNPVQVFAT
jgi:hypothetical protein